jgi:hypothetical protein
MTSTIRRFLATVVAAFAVALPASATSYSTDYSDLWWNSAENGWGLNLVQQYETIFATLYVYGPDNTPRWYFASDMKGTPTSFTGSLYRTTGPAFSGTFNPSAVAVTQVGTMTIAFNSAVTGTLTYSVDGVTIVKPIGRNTFRNNVLTGNFLGGMTANATGCANPANNGLALIFGNVTLQGGTTTSFRVEFAVNSVCIFTGTHVQQGRLGTIAGGTMTCTQAGTLSNQGTFTMSEIEVGTNGMSALITAADQFCNYNGRFGGVRDMPL